MTTALVTGVAHGTCCGTATRQAAIVTGTFRHANFLVTGLATDRVPEDDIVVVAVHFTKDPHGELSSVTPES